MSDEDSENQSVALKGLTPLLDTVFLLVFALLALSKSGSPGSEQQIHVHLPLIEKGTESPLRPAAVILEIDENSRIKLSKTGEVLASREALDHVLSAALQNGLEEETSVEIHADRAARNGTAVALLQHLRLRGFVNVTLLASGAAGADGDAELFGGPK